MDTPEVPAGGPLFLNPEAAGKVDYPGAPDASTVFDHELVEPPALPELPGNLAPMGPGPSEGYRIRHDRIAYLHALGYSNNQIAKHLGYSPTGISLALQRPWVQEQIAKHRSALIDPEVTNRIKLFAQDAVGYLHNTIHDPTIKDEIRSANARWGVEKYSGKPKQEIAHESNTFAAFAELLKTMHGRGEALDVTHTAQQLTEGQGSNAPQTGDVWDTWLDANP